MKALADAFNQEKALVGAFSVITNLRMELFQALPAAPHTLFAKHISQISVNGLLPPSLQILNDVLNVSNSKFLKRFFVPEHDAYNNWTWRKSFNHKISTNTFYIVQIQNIIYSTSIISLYLCREAYLCFIAL